MFPEIQKMLWCNSFAVTRIVLGSWRVLGTALLLYCVGATIYVSTTQPHCLFASQSDGIHARVHSPKKGGSTFTPRAVARNQNMEYTVPPCVAKQTGTAKSWLLVFMGHSGSTAIASQLKQHSQVYFDLMEPVDHDLRNDSFGALNYTREFFARGIAAGKSPGFKIRPNHILNKAAQRHWQGLVREFETRIIWQYRENIFKQAVGEYTHRYLNDTSAVQGLDANVSQKQRCRIGAGCRFRIDNMDFLHEMLTDCANNDEMISRAVRVVSAGSRCVLPIPYESYLYYPKTTMQKIQKFLGLTYEEHLPEHAKATSDSMCSAVENFGDVCNKFYGCHAWRHLMDDHKNQCYCSGYMSGPGDSSYCDLHQRS